MNQELTPHMVKAPRGAFAWSESRGWIKDAAAYDEARFEGGVVLLVDDDGWVRHVEGEASLTTLMRVDAHIYELQMDLTQLYVKLLDISENAAERLASKDNDST